MYGQAVELRKWLEKQGTAYVLGIACNEVVCAQAQNGYMLAEARDIAATLLQKEEDWQRLANGWGTKGPRLFDWARLPIEHKGVVDGSHFLLIRRCIDDPQVKSYYLVSAPPETTLQKMVLAIGGKPGMLKKTCKPPKALVLRSQKSVVTSDGIVISHWSC